jgi:tRNA A-37 threonylcarbamoyl transferase component Bud32
MLGIVQYRTRRCQLVSKQLFKEKQKQKIVVQETLAASETCVVAEASRLPIPTVNIEPSLPEDLELGEEIGSGGMGKIWKVYDRNLKQTFALKMIRHELADDPATIERFEQEARLVTELTHANIAASYGPRRDLHGNSYILMDFVDGESLTEVLAREGKMDAARAFDIFRQICDALAHSHMKGIIHRDIKPSNIILSKTALGADVVHVVDFGIAKSVYGDATLTAGMTKTEDVLGSPRYMSPEQFLGLPITAQSDIYSLACVFFEMLTGAPPFTEKNPVKLILQHLNETPDLKEVPARYKDVMELCLAKNSQIRPKAVEKIFSLVNDKHRSGINSDKTSEVFLVLVGAGCVSLLSQSIQMSFNHWANISVAIVGLAVWMALLKNGQNTLVRSPLIREIEIVILGLSAFTGLEAVAGIVLQLKAYEGDFGLGAFCAFLFGSYCFWSVKTKFYDKCINKLAFAECSNPRLTKIFEPLISLLYFLLAVLTSIGIATLMASALLFCETFDLSVTSALEPFAIGLFSLAIAITLAIFVGNTKELNDREKEIKRKKEVRKNWLLYASLNILTILILAITFWDPSLRSLMRNSVTVPFDTIGQKVRLEAARYPLTSTGAAVRILSASEFLWASKRNPTAALNLLEKVYDNQTLDPSLRASACVLMADAYSSNWRQASRYFDLAIQNFKNANIDQEKSSTQSVLASFLMSGGRASLLNDLSQMAGDHKDQARLKQAQEMILKFYPILKGH